MISSRLAMHSALVMNPLMVFLSFGFPLSYALIIYYHRIMSRPTPLNSEIFQKFFEPLGGVLAGPGGSATYRLRVYIMPLEAL